MWDHVRLTLGRALIVLGAALGAYWLAVEGCSLFEQYRLGNRLGSLHGTSRAASPVVVARATRAEADAEGLVGRIVIPRVGMNVVVLDGDDEATLSRGAGHIPRTAYPGERANAGIAGHRDSFFSSLHGVSRGDDMRVITPDGTFHYVVDKILIVGPERTDLLAPGDAPRLTLVTCYPFHWIGPAPKRFIVQAHWVSGNSRLADDEQAAPPPPSPPPATTAGETGESASGETGESASGETGESAAPVPADDASATAGLSDRGPKLDAAPGSPRRRASHRRRPAGELPAAACDATQPHDVSSLI